MIQWDFIGSLMGIEAANHGYSLPGYSHLCAGYIDLLSGKVFYGKS